MLLAALTHQLLNLQLRTAQATDLQCHHRTAEGDKSLMLQCVLHKTSDKKHSIPDHHWLFLLSKQRGFG